VQELADIVRSSPRGVLVAGRSPGEDDGIQGLQAFSAASGYPLLADPLSGARRGPGAIAHYDILLRHRAFAEAHQPELVIRAGDLPTSKPLREWLAACGARHWAVDPTLRWQDPSGVVDLRLGAETGPLLCALAAALQAGERESQPEWLAAWRRADERAAGSLTATLGSGLSEPAVAVELARALPAQATLFVASSMPVRDLESFWPVLDPPPRVLSNRGANGIDGTVSSALGAAAAADGPVVALIGDVALAHDLGGLIAARRLGLALTLVVINNDGGGIFEFLPVSGQAAIYEQHVATPHGLNFAAAASLYGFEHRLVGDMTQLSCALQETLGGPPAMIEVRTDRTENVGAHRDAFEAVGRALA
jgi:2-succinyl-5-enolpyruvyl-6-hydroxy-3-cyclohexene-1-carboxylate synthase